MASPGWWLVLVLVLVLEPTWCCTASAAAPAASASVHAAVDLTAASTDFQHYWKRCVGSGHLLLGTRQDWQDHLRLAHAELGFTGIRGHGLLDDDMSVLPGEWGSQAGTQWGLPSQQSPYEFYNVDTVYDFLVSIGVKPVVELSFMPAVLANCSWAVAPLDCHATSGLPCKNELPGAPRCEAGMAYQGVRRRRPRSQIAASYCRLPTLYQLH